MNITELARRLKITTQELKDTLPRVGFDIGQRAIKVDDRTAQRIIREWPRLLAELKERETSEEEKNKNWLRRERSSTNFYRHLELPEELKTDSVEAEMKDGVLTIKLPKVEPKPEFKTTKVKIK